MSKSLHSGLAAQTGMLAALLAKRNFTGPKHILEGPHGLFKAIAPDGSPIEIILEPEAPFRILDVSFKPWPACRHAHPAIDAALKLKTTLPPGTEFSAIQVHTYADAITFCDKPEPRVEIEAKFSIQHAVAVALVKNKPALDDFSPPFDNPKISAMRKMVSLHTDPAITREYPQHYGARIEATLTTGAIVQAAVTDAWGDPALPLNIQDLDAKFSTLLLKVGVLPGLIAELSRAVKQLPDQKSLGEFSRLLTRVRAG